MVILCVVNEQVYKFVVLEGSWRTAVPPLLMPSSSTAGWAMVVGSQDENAALVQ